MYQTGSQAASLPFLGIRPGNLATTVKWSKDRFQLLVSFTKQQILIPKLKPGPHLHQPRSQGLSSVKMRDPGNEVAFPHGFSFKNSTNNSETRYRTDLKIEEVVKRLVSY